MEPNLLQPMGASDPLSCTRRDVSINKEEAKAILKKSGNRFITAFQKLLIETRADRETRREYMQRVLHAIFFLGNINKPQIKPLEFLPPNMSGQYITSFPKAFTDYETHLPRQTPYSILLEYIAETNQDHTSIMEELQKMNKAFWLTSRGNQPVANDFTLSATVIAWSFICDPNIPQHEKCYGVSNFGSYINDPNIPQHEKWSYGASIACKGKKQRKIMIGVSALYVWDKAVSYAVCCGASGRGIHFPPRIHCEAHKYITRSSTFINIPACMKCHKMFVVDFHPDFIKNPDKSQHWEYGNCAETEAISKLLQGNEALRLAVTTLSDSGEERSRAEIEKEFRKKYEVAKQKEVQQLLYEHSFKGKLSDQQLFSAAA